MRKIETVLLVSLGSSESIDTWSGVPFFLRESLVQKGIRVSVLNLEPNRMLKILYNILICRFWDLFSKKGDATIYRSFFFRWYSRFKIQHSLRHPTDAIICCSYFINFTKGDTPVILLSDWSFSYVLHRSNRQPSKYLAYWNKKELENIKKADGVLSLFPTFAKYCNNELKVDKVAWLGINVVNTFNLVVNAESLINNKKCQRKIVFIGREHYIQAAIDLVEVLPIIRSEIPDVKLEIIGIERDVVASYVNDIDPSIVFWGYLSKSKPSERAIYDEALSTASVFVNTNAGWSGYSSMVEAMWHFTPVVVYPCEELLDEFGIDITFGRYCKQKINLPKEIISVLRSPNYYSLCINAHNAVNDYTWENYSERLIDYLSAIRNK